MMIKRLDELVPPQNARIHKIHGFGALRQRMMDMGLVPGAEINVVRVAPMGDPIEYNIKGYHLSLRGHEAKNILVEVGAVALDKLQPGENVRVLSIIAGRGASESLQQIGLKPGDTLTILRSRFGGRLVVQTGSRRLQIGRGLASRILVETLSQEEIS